MIYSQGDKSTQLSIRAEDLEIWKVAYKEKTYKEKTKEGKTITRKILQPSVVEYVDMSTGEIVSAQYAKMLGIAEINIRMLKLHQDMVLSKLRKEVKDFALFVLLFRNKRRGISPDLDQICSWYAEYTGARKDNIRRYIPILKEAGLLASDVLLMPMFQISGKNTKGSDHLSEDFEAECKFHELLKRRASNVSAD